jgi:hypothetical protein
LLQPEFLFPYALEKFSYLVFAQIPYVLLGCM